MNLNAYTVYDNKALVYGVPFFAPTDGAAIRSFRDLSNDAQTSVGAHPADYSLFQCGVYDDSNGAFAPLSPLRHVIDATACIVQPAQLAMFSNSDKHTNGEAA